jgi:hypothetical protein
MTAATKVYDGNVSSTINVSDLTLTGLVVNDDVTVAATGVFSDKNVATGKTITLSSNNTGIDAGNYTITDQVSASADITAKALTVAGIIAADKEYDGTTAATIDVTGQSFTGLVTGDTVTVAATGTFDDKNAATGKTVNLASTNSGADAGNYSVTGQATTLAGISTKALRFAGITASDKEYDGTTAATIDVTGQSFTGLVAGDAVTVAATGTFDDKNAATGKTVNLTSTNSGADAGNYSITIQETALAAISTKALTLTSATVADKDNDGSTDATVTVGVLAGLIGTETLDVSVIGAFDTPDGGLNKSVIISSITLANAGIDLTAGLASNYSIDNLVPTEALTGNIDQAAVVSVIVTPTVTVEANVTSALTNVKVEGNGINNNTPTVEASRAEASKADVSQENPPNVEASPAEAPNVEASPAEASNAETAQAEAAQAEAAQAEEAQAEEAQAEEAKDKEAKDKEDDGAKAKVILS